jgi:ribonuclease E
VSSPAESAPADSSAGVIEVPAAAPAERSTPAAAVAAPVDEPTEAPVAKATERRRSSATVSTPDATVAILDIPVATTRREPRRISSQDAEQLLDSVLGALPEPKQPGQGRSRSRRASSQGTTAAAPAEPTTTGESGPFILGVGVSSDDL